MSISDKILELRTHREAIREAINDKGVDLAEGSHMSDYAGAINEISGGGIDYSVFKGYTILTPDMVSGTIGSYNQKYIGTATHLIIDDSFPSDSLEELFRSNETLESLVILTDKFTNLGGLFSGGSTQLKNIFLNTSNVTDMFGMFQDTKATSLDLSSFDTSKVIYMNSMFNGSQATTLDLSSFDTSNVVNMATMFQNSKATNLDLSSFDTSNVDNMALMFMDSQATTLDLSSFDTSNVTNMNLMFQNSQANILDLSSFDTSKVTHMNSMFQNSKATTGYARTQADADKFNSSSNKPEGLNFVVKEA